MLRPKLKNHPQFDDLDSPLLSPALFTPSIIPGSALAERIFNDPESWDETEGDEGDLPIDVDESEPLSWLVEEIERFRATSTEFVDHPKFPEDEKDTFGLLLPPDSRRESGASLKGLARRSAVRPISLAALFERPGDDFTKEIQGQLSKILDSGGIPHQVRPFPSSASTTTTTLSVSGTPSTADTTSTASTLHTPYPPNSAASTAPSDGDAPIIHSASATLSFLEWYGIYPDSPGQEVTRKLSMVQRKRTLNSKRKPNRSPSAARPPSTNIHMPTPTTPLKQMFTADPEPLVVEAKEELPTPAAQPTETSRPSTPPGLTRPQGARVSPKTSMSTLTTAAPTTTPPPLARKPSVPTQASALPLPRTPSPPKDHHQRLAPVDTGPLPLLLRKPSMDQSSSASTPIRRLPSLPPTRSSTPPTLPPTPAPQNTSSTPSRTNSPVPGPLPPLPSSVPTPASSQSPAFTPSTLGMSPMSAQSQPTLLASRPSVRSPLGGPVGPRTRASTRATSTQTQEQQPYTQRVLSATVMPTRSAGLRL